jgi:zinc protease
MISFRRRGFSQRFSLALGLTIGAIVLASLARTAEAVDWPQAYSDLRADPAVLFGTLPNGMKYAIMHNATPKGAIAMRLNIAAGSRQESDAQQGLAHFLEHMAFRGSKHVPEKEVWPGLARLGMAFGADANATTLQTSTQYKLNLPHNDAKTIGTGLMRLRDIASELTLAQKAMDAERGVILSEERLRDTPVYRAYKQELALLIPHDRLLARMPIGLTDVIKHAPVSLIRDYYNAYYRPKRATLIVVGDVDPKAIQAKISKLFADWKPVGPAGSDPARNPPGARRAEAALFSEAGAPSALLLVWATKAEPDTKVREQDDWAKQIALKIVRYRLGDIVNGPQHVFAGVGSNTSRNVPGSVFWSVNTVIRPQDWRVALNAAVLTVRRMQTYGVMAAEVERAKSEFLASLQALAARAGTLPNSTLADLLAVSVNTGEVFDSPADALALAKATFKDLTVAKVNAAIGALMRDHGPLLFLSTPTSIEGGQATVTAALAAAEKAPLTRPAAEAQVVWPYTHFGPTGHVAERKTITDLQTTFVRFANGVRLTVKPTTFRAGQVVVVVRVGNGRLDLPAHRDSPIWAVDDDGPVFGGLKAISFEEMQRALAGKVLGLHTRITDDGLLMVGRTRPTDLVSQLQVFAAYVAAPGWRVGALERARTTEVNKARQSAASPTRLFVREAPCLLHGGDRRWCAPSLAELATVKPEALRDMMAPILASAPIEVTMAGDVTVDAAIKAVATTLGALPARAEPGAGSIKTIALHFPKGTATPVVLLHQGRSDQGVAALAWPATDYYDLKNVQILSVLRSVLATRITDELRIRDGATYSPLAVLGASKIAPGYGFLVTAAELPTAKMPLFFSTTESIVADLRAHAISDDELERARKPQVEQVLAQQQTNGYWASVLLGAQRDARRVNIVRSSVAELKKVTAADIQQAAKAFLADGKAWKLEIRAQPAAASAH